MALTTSQKERFHKVLLSAFPGLSQLRRLMSFEMSVELNEVVTISDPLETVAFDLIKWAESRGRLDDLIVAAQEQNEGNVDLKSFVQELRSTGWVPVGVPTAASKSLHQLRGRGVPDFVGRQGQIDRLVKAFSKASESGKPAIGGIRGMGGLGKSELAYVVAQRLEKTFPDAQLLLEMRGASDNPMTAGQALQEVIRTFTPLAQLPDDLHALQKEYLSVLSEKRVLILADDASDERQVETLAPPPGCALLLTSRQRFSLPGMVPVDLETLPQEEAEKLLLEIYPEIGTAAPRMAQLCGRLPLALRLYAGVCANSPFPIEYDLKALEDARLAHLQNPNKPDDPQGSVEASLKLSYDALEVTAQQALCQLSVFPAGFDMDAAKAVVGVEDERGEGATANRRPIEEMLRLLYRRSLLESDKQTGRYSLHDLVRVFALERLEDADAVRMRHAQHYVEIAYSANDLYLKGGENLLVGLKLFDQERAHIDGGWNWAREQAGSALQGIDVLLVDYADATAYVGDLRYDKRRERILQLEAAFGAAQRLGRKEAESTALGNLGNAYAALGEARKAIEYYEQVLQIAREIRDRRSEAIGSWNLGELLAKQGDLARAVDLMQVLVNFERAIGHADAEKATAIVEELRKQLP